jgi:eukaryotic-like serine/threonine-protein kinase
MSSVPNQAGSSSDKGVSDKGVLSSSSLDTEVGRLAVEIGLVTRNEVDFCREQQKQASDPNSRSLGDLLVEHNFLTVNQAKRVRQVVIDGKSSRNIPGYELIKEVGKGAMAKVYLAKQISLNRRVAVKILPKKSNENKDFVDRFYKEGQAAARLSHNNIVQAIDVGESPEGLHYFVMEFVEGKTLYDLMAPPPQGEGKSFSEAEALDVGIQMADALAHAHQRGLIHRDVKPKNIILTPQGIAKLTDLGLARQMDDKRAAEMEAGKAYGTPYYISPEQIRGDMDIDFRADIYSLGATLYHLVTGKPPFEGETPAAVMHQHLRQPLVPADHINTALSAGVGEIIDVAMAKRREDRYQSTEQMLEDLRLVRNNEAPKYARRAVDLESLAKIEETGKTVDLVPSPTMHYDESWKSPLVMKLVWGLVTAVICDVVLVILLFLLHK